MKASTRSVDGVEIISLQGKITIGAGDTQLREVISNALNSGKTNVLLDLSGVTTIDSCHDGSTCASRPSAFTTNDPPSKTSSSCPPTWFT